ncbi:MAG: Wzy polymerase domain-containing protein [Gallionellaceae bacterium]|nr:Wzy polymerase domain-containing protein [Gallionellaceae bacterium]
MWVLPFLYYHHAYPITTFYQEWGAAVLGVLAMPLLVSGRYWQQPEIPRIVLLPIGMMLLLLVQYLLGKIPSLDQTLLLTMYFLWMALLVMLGHRLRIELGLPKLALILAVFLVVGAELNALAGILQHYRWHTFLSSVITVKTSSAVYGNIAQPNHFANYLALGLASIGLLYIRWSMRAWQVALLAVPLLFVLALSGSRGTWLYLVFMVGMSYLWQRNDKSYLPLLKYSAALLVGLALMHWVVQMPWLAGSVTKVTSLERLFGEVGGGSIRLHLWKESLLIFANFPLIGAGFGQFAWQHFLLGPELQNISISGLYNNAHNVVMQLAAETGLAGLIVLFGTLGLWFWHARREHRTLYQWWGYMVLGVLGIHALLEYPLWYGYFIGIAAVALGLMETKTYRLELRALGRLSVAMMLLLGALSLTQLFQGYKKLESSLKLRPASSTDASYTPRLRDSLAEVYDYALLRPYAELFMTGMIEPSADLLAEKIAMNEHAMRFVPIAPVVYRQAWLLALSDRLPEAKTQLKQSLWSYPNDFKANQAELKEMALKDPAHFSALLEFATQENEEYQRAVSAK